MPTSEQNAWLQSALGVAISPSVAAPSLLEKAKSAATIAVTAAVVATSGAGAAASGAAGAVVRTVPTANRLTSVGSRMAPDCKPVRGRVPGPAHHLLCETHGHVLDIKACQVIADSVNAYKEKHVAGSTQESVPSKNPTRAGAQRPAPTTANAAAAGKKKEELSDLRLQLRFAVNDAESAMERYVAQKQINDEHWIVSKVSGALGGANDPGAELQTLMLQATAEMTSGYSAAAGNDAATARRKLETVRTITKRMKDLARAYCDDLAEGAGSAAAGLEVVSTAGDAATMVLGVVAPPAGTALSIGKKGAVAGSKLLNGQEIDWTEFTVDVALELFLAKYGDTVAGKLTRGVEKQLAAKIATGAVTRKVVEEAVKGLVLHESSEVLKTTLQQTFAALSGKDVTWEKAFDVLIERMTDPQEIVISFIASGIGGVGAEKTAVSGRKP